jgi:hypothetical protein
MKGKILKHDGYKCHNVLGHAAFQMMGNSENRHQLF